MKYNTLKTASSFTSVLPFSVMMGTHDFELPQIGRSIVLSSSSEGEHELVVQKASCQWHWR